MEDNAETVRDNPLDASDEHSTQHPEHVELSDVRISGGTGNHKREETVDEHLSIHANPEVTRDSDSADAKEMCLDAVAGNEALIETRAEREQLDGESGGELRQGFSSASKYYRGEDLDYDVKATMYTSVEEQSEVKLEEEVGAFVKDGESEVLVPTEAQVQQGNDLELEKGFYHKNPSSCFLLDPNDASGNESGTEEEQDAFLKELEIFHKERCLDFKPPKFYQELLNCLKLWRAVIRLGGYEQVTSLKLWRQVGESFHPPKTCTTVSWTFRGFYEKALLEYEKHKMRCGELPFTDASVSDPTSGTPVNSINNAGSGRARRGAAARAMQGWHSQRLLGNGEVGDSNIKDKNPTTTPKREKQLKNIGFLKRKGSYLIEQPSKCARETPKSPLEILIVDVGTPADWVKVNVQRMNDCYEVYALVPGFLREEVHVQSDPGGRLVISGQPEQEDNPWGVTPFKKVVSLPTRIDPHHTSAVVTLHGQLFVRVPLN